MLTDRLIFVHVFRTGGFLVRAVLREIPGLRILSDQLHMTYGEMVARCEGYINPVPRAIAFVRNPWSWYVSMWGTVWWYPNLPFVGTFREYMETIRDGAIDDPNFVTFTEHWDAMGADNADDIGRFEGIYGHLARMLFSTAAELMEEKETMFWAPGGPTYDFIHRRWPRFHPALEWPSRERTKHYSHYYTPELRRWVEDWDGELIERFGYRFERG